MPFLQEDSRDLELKDQQPVSLDHDCPMATTRPTFSQIYKKK